MRNVSTSLKPRVPFSFHQPVRVLLALIICFVITPQEGTAQLCDCTDYIYLADQQPGGGLDTIGKYRIEADGSLTEIGSPWFVAPSDITLVSGVAQDRNGYIYAGEDQFSGDTRRLTCDGTLDPEASFVVNDRGYNLGVLGDLLLINTIEFDFVSPDAGDSIHAYRLCDGSLVGAVGLTGLGASVAGQVDWGFQVLDNGYVLATADIGLPGGNAVWYFQPTETNFANGDGFAPIFTEANSDLSSGNLFGITTDGNFIYIVETAAGGASTIYKYDFSGNEIGFISDGAADGVGFFAAIGIVFSQSTGYLYVTSQQMDDCIARIDTTGTMSYDGVALPPNLDGSGVALTIATECCPSSPSVTIDTTLCNIAVNDSFFLQDLIACDGPVCEGTWTADGGNSGVTFNTCDFSVRIDDISGCGTFTLTSAGGLCGAFTITLNIDFTTITSPTMSADQLVCAGSEADTLFAAGAASPTGLTFQWQESAGSCTGPFTDIAGATDTFFVPGAISDTMFYRLISSAPGGCDYDTCRDTSACITVLFVDPACQASTNSPICEGDALQLMETGGDAVAWSWSTTNGGVFSDPNAQNPTVTGVVDGETFTVTITDANGCTSVCTTVATVRELPGCAATNSGPICDGETLTIEETGGDAVSWSWASSGSAVIADPSAMVTTATNVSDGEIFTVTVTDIDGCMSTCTTVAVVNALPMATAGNSGAICDGETLDLTETGGDAVAWSWSSDGTAAINNINDQNPQATGVANGEIFTVTVTDVNGCTSTATTTATVNALPACSASTGGAICDEGTLTLMETGGDATGWSWSSDGGATIMDANMATATATGVTHGETFTVTVTDANGCTSTCTVVAVVNDLPGCAATNSGPICAGESLTIEETGGDAVSWSWTSNGAAVIADPSAMVTTATNVADGEIFTVTVTDANGCTSTCTTVATVNPLPTATAGNSGAICDGETLDLSETGGDAVAWSWSSNGAAVINNINDQNPQATGVSNGEIFTVTVTDVNGCTSTASTTAIVNALPACSASTGGAICDDGTLTLMETGGDATGWSWSSDGDATIMDANMATATATGVTHGETFTVTVTDANGCTSTCTVVAVVNDLPGCAATNSGPICAGEALTIEETGGDAVSWSWTSSGAAVIADPSAMVTTATNVADGEIFTVTVTDANGCTSTCTTEATVNPLPAAAAGNSGPICAGETLDLSETGGDAVSWSWSSNGTAAFNNPDIQNPQATGVTNGEIFTVTVTDANGCTSTATTTATVNALPACAASTGGAICAGGTLTLMETGGDATGWSWTSNGSATIMDANMASATATDVTNGEIFTVVVTDANGCTSSCSVMAVVNDLPGCAASNSGPICEGEPLTIEETGGDAVAWSWSSNGAAVFNDPNSMVAWATNVSDGEIFTVTVTDANGCTSTCSTTAIVYPQPAAVASNNGPICSVESLDLMETGGDAIAWEWSSSGSAAFNDPFLQNPTVTGVSNNEIFTVTVTDANGCTNSASTVATVNTMPSCGASNDGPICEGETLTLTDSGNWSTWSWSSNGSAVIDDPNAQTTTATNVTDGEIFTVIIVDANGCSDTCTTVATVFSLPGCAATNSGPICAGETLTIEETGGDAVSWSWSSNGAAIIADPSAMVTTVTNVSDGEIFTVTVTDANGCSSTCTTVAVVNATPTAAASNSGPICDGATLDLMETGGDAVAWSWSSSGTAAFNNPNIQNPQATGVVDGEIFTVVVTDINGCTSSATTTATVNALPTCTASNDGPICEGGTLTIEETGGDAISWSWSSDGGAVIADPSMATTTATGVSDGEIFTVTITDANGCTSVCSTTAVVNALPVCTIDGDDEQCQNTMGAVYAAPDGMSTYAWSISGAGASIVGASDEMTVTIDLGVANATLGLTITDANGCTSSCSLEITILDPPVCQINGSATVCPDAEDVIYIGSAGMASYSWSVIAGDATIDGADDQQAVLIDFGTMSSTLQLEITDVNGCTASCTYMVTVQDITPPVFVNCPVAVMSGNDPSDCGALVNWSIPVAQDNCDSSLTIVRTMGPASGSFIPVNTPTTITYEATDDSGNTATCSFTVTVFDTENPVAVCENITIYLDGSGNETIVPADIDGGSTDNCGIATRAISAGAFDCDDVGSNNVTLTITDVNGNMASCVAEVTVLDTIAPSFTCPADMTVSGCVAEVPDLVSGLAGTDNCDDAAISFTQDPLPGVAFGPNAGDTIDVIITATDASGNTATCAVTLTVVDDELPVFVSCPTNIFTCNEADVCGASVNWSPPVAVDNCDDTLTVMQTMGPASGSVFPLGTTSIVYQVTDDDGNTATCAFEITVLDCQSPDAICQDVTVYLDDMGMAAITVDDVDGGSYDNCAVATRTASQMAFTCANTGGNQVTLVVGDLAGNLDSCVAIVSVLDTIPPTFACPADLSVSGCVGVVPDLIGGLMGSDNCSAVAFTQNPLPGVAFGPNAGDTINVVITATDSSGNATTCTVVVTILDDEMPVFVNCPADLVTCNDIDACGGTVNWADPVAVDNCDDTLTVVQTGGPLSGSFFPIGTTLITYTATDDDGNVATCTFNVVVEDCQNPDAICQDINIALDAMGSASISPADIDGGSFDNCSISMLSISQTDFDCSDLGDNNITLVVTDPAGNADSCVAVVTVLDTIPPIFACPADMTVSGCVGTVLDLLSGLIGTDDCGGAVTFSQSPDPGVAFGPNAGDTIAVTITASDESGNTSTCAVTLTIVDNEMPVFVNCPPSPIIVCTDNDLCAAVVNWAPPVAVDNCDDTLTVTQIAGPPSGSAILAGMTSVTYEAVDDDGNSTQCSFDIFVIDCQKPDAICQDINVYLDGGGMATIAPADIDGGSFDNCGISSLTAAPLSFTCADVGANNVTLVATDATGNVDSCVAEVTVIDTIAPTFACPADMTVSGCAGTVPDLISGLVGMDNCGLVTFIQDPLPGVAFGPNADDTIAVIITATDVNGNHTTCSVTLTIIDNEMPVFVNCPVQIDVCNDIDACVATVNWFDPVAVDNCDDTLSVVQIAGPPSGSPFPIGTTTITYQATDDDGNATTCSFDVVVADCQNPDAICQTAEVFLDASGDGTITAADIDGGSFDNCAIDTVIASNTAFDCSDIGNNNVTLTVIDTSGNADSCVALVIVHDLIAPSFACPADMTVDGCSGTVPDLIAGLMGMDNCGPVTFTQDPVAGVTFGPNANDSINVVITATDASGNTATCTVTLTILDDQLPVFVNCPDTIQVCNDVDACGALVNWADPVAVDNCDDTLTVVQTGGLPSGSFFPPGATLITYEATDDDGNTTTCTFVVVVDDCQNPNAICADANVYLDASGMATIDLGDINGGSYDNCAIDTIIASLPVLTCDDVGSTNITMIVIDTVGNADSCVAEVTVLDTIPPMFACPADMTVDGCSGTVPDLISGLVGTDNCDDAGITFAQNPLPNVTFGPNADDTIAVVITATDVNGNTATCEVILTIIDDELPVFVNCPDTIQVCNDVDICGATVNWLDPVAVDNCDDTLAVVQTGGLPSGSTFPVGTTLVTYQATDDNGNATTCTFVVIVDDCQNPSAICADAQVLLDADGMAAIAAADIDGGSFDNCALDTLIISQTDFDCDDVGQNNVTLIAIDTAGNADSCVAEVTVVDLIPPQFTCPEDMTVDGCSGTIPDLISGLSGTDNCDDAGISFTQDPLPGVTFGPNADDTIAVVITATDVNGNTATCEVILTIIDDQLPVFVNCPDTIQACNDVDVCGATVNWFDPIAVDNCDDTLTVVQTGGLPSGSVFPVGTTIVTYQATDDDGNATTCTFVVIVEDCQNPNAICADAQIYLDETGMATINIAAIDGGSYDNCAIDTMTASIPVFTCDDVGTTNVTMIVFDTAGNADSCVAEINVLDTIPPMFVCPADMTVTGCSGTIPDLVTGLTGTDNCGDDGIVFSQDPLPNVTFGPDANDTIEVIITATDVNGNTATCGVTLTIVDNEDPVFVNCPDTIAVNNDPGVCGALVNWFAPVAVDNCDDTMDVVQTLGPPPGSEFPVGTTQIAYTATDDDGNSVTCTFVVVVSDSEPPEAVCQDIFVYVDDNCEYMIGADEVDGGSTDNCAVDTLLISRDGGANFSDSVGFTIADLADPFVPVILLVTDAAGNTAQCVATVTVIDAQDPMVICQEDITVNTEPGHCHGIIPNIIPPFDTTDNCAPVVNLDQYPEAGLLFGTAHGDSLEIFLIATDIDGNMDTCSLFVFLEDNEAPEWLNCPRPPIVQKAMPAACGAFINFSPPIALDNCELDTIIQVDGTGLQSGDMFPVGITVLSWIAIDVAGNISDTCDIKVIVNDAQPPTLACPADVVTFNDPGECGAIIDDIAPVATDNCPDNLAVIYEVQDAFGNVVSCGVEDASGTFFPVGSNTVIYRAYDQPIVLITEIAQSGADMLEITNFGPASVNLECLTIERLGAGAESAVVGNVVLAPGDIYVHAFANDIAESDGAEYQISVEGTVHDVVATNGYAASTGWSGTLDGGNVWRYLICDHDTAEDWQVVDACLGASMGALNPGLPFFADNGSTTGLQSQLPNIIECSFNVTINDVELPYCTELNVQLYETNDIPVAFDADCATSVITIADNFEVGQLNVLDLTGTTTGGVGALTVSLTSPAGTTVVLFSGLCGPAEDFDLGLSDTSLVNVNAAPCGPLGVGFSYMPQEALIAFCGENVNGDWTLSIESESSAGSLTSWSLQFLEQLPWTMTDTILDNDPGECGGVFTWTHAAFGDNCCEGTIRVDYETQDGINVPTGGIIIGGEEVTEFFEVGTTTVIYTLTDQAGNTSQCEFDVTVLDAELPELVCPADLIVNLDPGACAVPVNFLPSLASDNCGIIDTISDTGTYFAIGQHEITIVVTDAAGNTASCTFDLSVLEYIPQDGDLTCNDTIQLSLDQNCEAQVNADMILEGDDYRCYDNYCIYVIDANGDTVPNALFTLDHVNQCFTVSIVDCLGGGNSCWGVVCVEEKLAPEIACPPDTIVACNQSTDISITGQPELLSCEGGVTIDYIDDVTNFGECSDPRVRIVRTWTVTDDSGNSTTCEQIIEVAAYDESQISWPADFVDANAFSCDDVLENPLLTDPSNTGVPMINGEPIFGDHYCEVRVATWDKIFVDANCSGSYTILRYWEILNDCEPIAPNTNPIVHIQVIEVNDDIPPALVCPQDFTISADPWFCVTSTILPLPIAFDGCSELGVTSIQVSGGSLLNMGPDGYILANLQPDETYTVTIKVKDECKNTAECTYTVTVIDNIAPVPICDEHTVVSLIEDGSVEHGLTKVPVSTFDDGSYDNCGPVTIEARRMTSCIDFDWTTNGAGYDDDPNGVVNSADRGLTFGPYVPFACCDAQIGSGSHAPPVMVQVRITDAYGNVNFCMVEVEVQDKLSPFVECLPDIEVSCEYWFEAYETNGFVPLEEDILTGTFGTMLDAYSYDLDDRAPIIINDPGRPTNPSDPNYLPQPHQWGIDGWTDDNCEVEITVRVRIFDDCTGDLPGAAPDHATRLIERTFRSRDVNNNSTVCVQRIWVVDFTPFYIADETCNNSDPNDGVIWPCDKTYTTCPGEIPVDYPSVFDDNCNLIGVDYDDEVFTFVDGACMKILRTWTVIDWCQYDVTTGEGLWTYVQIIKVLDDTGPIFTDCPGTMMTLCVEDQGVTLPDNNQLFLGEGHPDATSCSAHVTIEHEVDETCSGVVLYDVKLYLYDGPDYIQVLGETEATTDSNDIATLVFDSRLSSDLTTRLNGIPYNNNVCSGGPKDYHRILWTVEDGCGNQSTCSYLLRVEDCKKPTPVCVGLQSVVMPSSGSVTIWASDFNASSVDDCTPTDQLLFSFSGTEYSPGMDFDCALIQANGSPSFIIEIWAADEGTDINCDGQISWDERNKDFCTTFIVIDDNENVCPGSGSVGGDVHTEEYEPVEGVRVNMMDELGLVMQTYITGDNGTFQFFNPLLNYTIDAYRNDDHKNGVSSLDLVRIQKHLLGIEPFTSPYKRIAADANNNQAISAVDLVEIRKVILGVNLEFPNNTSWRFVDADHVFTDPEHPWPFDEVIELDNLTIDQNFMAIKVGDVNGTVVANANQIETRNPVGALIFEVEDRAVMKGEELKVPFLARSFVDIVGYQFTLRTEGLSLVGIQPGLINISEQHFGIHAGAITTSWHDAQAQRIEDGAVLFTLHFEAAKDGQLSDLLSIGSRITHAEAYAEKGATREIVDLDVSLSFCTECEEVQVWTPTEFALFQNEPNPASGVTSIGFSLPEDMDAELTLYDATGRVMRQYSGSFTRGFNEILIEFATEDLAPGVLYYRLDAGEFSATKKMIVLRE